MEKYKNKNQIYKDVTIIILFIFAYFLFFLSLEKCYEGEASCCRKFKWMKKKVVEELISCFIIIILCELMLLNKISRLHIFHFIITFFVFYSYSNGIDFDDHGYYNIKYYFVIIIFFLIIILFINCLFYIKKQISILFILSLIIFLYLFSKVFTKYNSCIDWPKGLNNTSIDNNELKYGCIIKIPKYCLYKIGKFFLDKDRFSKCVYQDINAKDLIMEKSTSPFINKKTMNIGFPLTNKDDKYFYDMGQNSYKRIYFHNFIDMDNSTLINILKDNKPEVSVDFSKDKNGIMNINLNYNQTLVKERKSLEHLVNPLYNNILVLFIDSVSRANSIRQLKKTLNFIESFMPFNGKSHDKYPYENFHSFQFFKYHSHKYYTSGNYPILFYGNHRNQTHKYLTYYLKQNGFITAYSADECFNDFSRAFHNFTFDEIYDHEYIICDPNYRNLRSKLNCFYGKLHVEYMLEYMNQFWRKYKNSRKFSLLLTNFAHENTLEKLKYIDKIIYNYFYELFKENLLKETIIFLLSDHGVAVPSIYYLNEFFQIEKVLPMFYLLINDRKNVSYESQYKYLYQNQQVFITGFDIYNTFIHIIYGDKFGTNVTKGIKSLKGASLFKQLNLKVRSSKNFVSMDKDVCI